MTEVRTLLRRALGEEAPAPDALERTTLRARRRRARRRVTSAVTALALSGLAAFILMRAFSATTPPTPAAVEPTGMIVFIRAEARFVAAGHDAQAPADPQLFAVPAAGGNVTPLTAEKMWRSSPVVSPDGQWIALSVGEEIPDGPIAWSLQVVPATRGRGRSLTTCEPPACLADRPLAWSPDGTEIAFWSDRGSRPGVWVVRADGSGVPTRLAPAGAYTGGLVWALDGRTLTFATGRWGRPFLRTIDVASGEVVHEVVVSRIESIGGLSLSPDGRTLVLEGALDSGDWAVFTMPANGVDPTLLTACTGSGCSDGSPAWSPDGRFVAFVRGSEWGGDVYLIRADGTELRTLTAGRSIDCCLSWTAADLAPVTTPQPDEPTGDLLFPACPSLLGTLPTGEDERARAEETAASFVQAYLWGDDRTLRELMDPATPADASWAISGEPDEVSVTSSGSAAQDGLVTQACGSDAAERTWAVSFDDGTESASLDFILYLVVRTDGWKVWGSY